jgi:hypothetical protein
MTSSVRREAIQEAVAAGALEVGLRAGFCSPTSNPSQPELFGRRDANITRKAKGAAE